jgi:hypothetical protein
MLNMPTHVSGNAQSDANTSRAAEPMEFDELVSDQLNDASRIGKKWSFAVCTPGEPSHVALYAFWQANVAHVLQIETNEQMQYTNL